MVERHAVPAQATGPDAPESGDKTDNPANQFVTPGEQNSQAPDWLPEKFRGADDPYKALAEAYTNLESKFTKTNQGDNKKGSEQATKEAPADDQGETDENSAADEETSEEEGSEDNTEFVIGDLTHDEINSMSAGFWENGELSEGDYERLEKAGISKNLADQFAQGQKALMDAQKQTVMNAGGGEKKVGKIVEWANKNLSQDQLDYFDKQINGGDVNTAALAMESLKTRYDQANGTKPKLVQDGGTSKNKGDAYESVAQMQADMSDPRYQTDPAFRDKVVQKLGRSSIL